MSVLRRKPSRVWLRWASLWERLAAWFASKSTAAEPSSARIATAAFTSPSSQRLCSKGSSRSSGMPAIASHLQNLRRFNEELRTALGVPTFYNEALGSVSQVSVYDRVKGRKGDVPDTTVGAHSPGSAH